MSVTELEAGEDGVKDGLKERADGELGELSFGIARDAREDSGGVVLA